MGLCVCGHKKDDHGKVEVLGHTACGASKCQCIGFEPAKK